MAFLWGGMFCIGAVWMLLSRGGDATLACMLSGAMRAVTLCLDIAGGYLLFTGMLGIAEKAGLLQRMTRALDKPMRLLFPNAGSAVGEISLALAANALGLGNAATPLGISAMHALQRENPAKNGVGTADMCAFVAINASALQLLPTGLIALLGAAGSVSPARIVLPSLIASAAATLTAIVLCRVVQPK